MATTPMTATATAPNPPKWVTIEDAEKLEKMLFKHYIPKNDEKFAKKFYYRVESIIPYTPVNEVNGDASMYQFMIQKYHRNKTEKVSTNDGSGHSQEVERNQRVESHEMRNGKFVVVDAYANRLIDSAEFKAEFKPDDVE